MYQLRLPRQKRAITSPSLYTGLNDCLRSFRDWITIQITAIQWWCVIRTNWPMADFQSWREKAVVFLNRKVLLKGSETRNGLGVIVNHRYSWCLGTESNCLHGVLSRTTPFIHIEKKQIVKIITLLYRLALHCWFSLFSVPKTESIYGRFYWDMGSQFPWIF